MFGSLGAGEILIVGLVAALLFGAGRIASVGKGLGDAVRNFKKGLNEADEAD
jgi:sec-independent protein translocase protein TatA